VDGLSGGRAVTERRGDVTSQDGWEAYFDRLPPDPPLYREGVELYVARLQAAVGVAPGARVLDFGCGFGYASELLAAAGASVRFWDLSSHMRRVAEERTAAHPTAAPTDVTPALRGRTVDGAPFDRIVVNSVVQYMTDAELDGWLAAWRDLLAPGGKVVLSDLIDPDRGGLRDLADLLWFGVRHGAPVQAVTSAFGSVTAYWRTRRAAPLLQLRPAELGARAARAGLRSTALDGNLTHFSQRWTAVLERAA